MSAPRELNIDARFLDTLTLGDIEDLEEYAGISVAGLASGGTLPVKALSVLAWIVKRRDDEAFTLNDARKIRFVDLVALLDPTSAVPTPLQPLRDKTQARPPRASTA